MKASRSSSARSKNLRTRLVAIGFGISNREQAERFSRICDGVVVGSAIVRTIEESIPLLQNADTRQDGLLQIRKFVSQLKA